MRYARRLAALGSLLAAHCTSVSPAPDATLADAATELALDAPPDQASDARDAAPDVPRPTELTVFAAPALADAVTAWGTFVPETGVVTTSVADPFGAQDRGDGAGVVLAVTSDLTTCSQCYRLEAHPRGVRVHADGVLGAQYGLSHALEAMGYRFFHPLAGVRPTALAPPAATALPAEAQIPEQTVRGLHLHTLHPIESQVFMIPGDDNAYRARAIIDWLVRNRGNYLNLVALNNILDAATRATWAAHLGPLIAYAHQRGVRVGLGIQLFSGSNLQHAFDLLAKADDPGALDRITQRLTVALGGMGFDVLSLSFGEFSASADPASFIARVNDVRTALDAVAPSMELGATIHVGNLPALRVSYMGETQLYYFLVRYADPRIVPWIHTVMYYDLFEDTGGAYLHNDFSEHRAYLQGRLQAGQRVVYHPESAYWVNFDNPVPTFMPLYLRSRWLDMNQLRAQSVAMHTGDLREHVTFSSGWEWGYWLTDVAVLRQGFHLPEHYDDTVREELAIYGAAGSAAADAVTALAELHHDALLVHHLAAYLASRDFVTEGGAMGGVISQPDRPTFDAVRAMNAADRDAFTHAVLEPLDALAMATAPLLTALNAALGANPDNYLAELRDGVEIDLLRTRFAAAVWRVAVNTAATGTDGGTLATAQQQMDLARAVVRRRHAALHWPTASTITARWVNPTLYQYGYLYMADQLCYWQRELTQARNTTTADYVDPPGCFF